jgi:hypothetical protein
MKSGVKIPPFGRIQMPPFKLVAKLGIEDPVRAQGAGRLRCTLAERQNGQTKNNQQPEAKANKAAKRQAVYHMVKIRQPGTYHQHNPPKANC